MTNASKILSTTKKTKKEKKVRIKKIKVDLSVLQDAFATNIKLVVGQEIYFERTQYGKTNIHEGIIQSLPDENGYFGIYDYTLDQCYGLNINQTLPVIKLKN